jgi:diaminopimelate epimerase
MVASGNDFMVIDNRKGAIVDAGSFAKRVCEPHVGVGADGVLLIESAKRADFAMRIINADGSEAEACGNGFRCLGLYAHKLLGLSKTMTVETPSGEISIEIKSKSIRVKMVDPKNYKESVSLSGLSEANAKKVLNCSFIDTGVPHAVIFAESLQDLAVHELGASVRYHDAFGARGANVDFVQVIGKDLLEVRTYERGVEAETLACGTGATAAAVVAHLKKQVMAPVQVKTRSGETLTIHMENSGREVQNVYLEGNAQFVYEGTIEI